MPTPDDILQLPCPEDLIQAGELEDIVGCGHKKSSSLYKRHPFIIKEKFQSSFWKLNQKLWCYLADHQITEIHRDGLIPRCADKGTQGALQ